MDDTVQTLTGFYVTYNCQNSTTTNFGVYQQKIEFIGVLH